MSNRSSAAPPPPPWPAVLPYLATVVALGAAGLHIFHPAVEVDAIGLSLLLAPVLVWLLPLVKSIKFGGAELELIARLDAVEEQTEQVVEALSDVGADTDTADAPPETAELVRALKDPRFTFRSTDGIARQSKLDSDRAATELDSLRGRGLVIRTRGREGPLWALSSAGKAAFRGL